MKNVIWSDNIWIEEDKAWFAGANLSALFQLDLKKDSCEIIKEFPDFKFSEFRRNSRCIKCGNNIFCFPDFGNCIYIYDLIQQEFTTLEINNQDEVRLGIVDFWHYDNKIYSISRGLKKILIIDILKKEIINTSNITRNPEEQILSSIKVGGYIYIVSSENSVIYEYSIETNKTKKYIVPELKEKMFTIAFDGNNFWLSGYTKEIYVWNKEKNIVKKIINFPEGFGVYNFKCKDEYIIDYNILNSEWPLFFDSICSDKYIWYIPFVTNKIVYINKETYEIKYLQIKDEEENANSLKNRQLNHKYLVLYFRDDRILGLYSFKNRMILEIDLNELSWKYRNIELNLDKMEKFLNKYKGYILNESKDKEIFCIMLNII